MSTRKLAVLTGALVTLAGSTSVPASAAETTRADSRIPGRYVVVYRGTVTDVDRSTARREREHGFRSRYRYHDAIKGFSARLSRAQVRRLRKDPAVAFVDADRRVRAVGSVPLASNEPLPPTGLRRISAATTTTTRQASTVRVAVIDTGIDLNHPDLDSAVDGKNCLADAVAQDDNGHGSHVAGTIGADNDGAGVVGMAPGTTMYAVKVLDRRGSGSWSSVICGVDWVTSTRTDGTSSNDVAVANMSLGGGGDPIESTTTCSSMKDALRRAICNSTNRGVLYAVAAGNSGWDFDYEPIPDVPAAYPEVLTVTALSDSDGLPGGTGGAPSCRTSEKDDAHAGFSNWASYPSGEAHTIAAPGVCIKSTWKSGGYDTISGTSMATPHIAGAVALCLGEGGSSGPCTGLTPAQIISKVRSDADSYNRNNTGYGFFGDPLRPVAGEYFGFITYEGTTSGGGGDTTAPTAPKNLTAGPGDASVTLNWDDNSESDLAGYHVYRSHNGGAFGLLATLGKTSAYSDSGLNNGDTYSYYVKAFDTSNHVSAASNTASATPTAPATSGFDATGSGYKVKGVQHARIEWTGGTANGDVTISRTGMSTTRTSDGNGAGSYDDNIGKKGGGSYTYTVCDVSTSTCDTVTVVF